MELLHIQIIMKIFIEESTPRKMGILEKQSRMVVRRVEKLVKMERYWPKGKNLVIILTGLWN